MIIWNPWHGCHKLGHCVIKHDVNDIMAQVLAVVFNPIPNNCSKNITTFVEILQILQNC